MEILVIIIVAAAALFLFSKLFKTRQEEPRPYTDDELAAMSEEEWEALTRSHFRKEDTKVLVIYARQYADLKQRIADGHQETLRTLNDQSKMRSLRSAELVSEELSRRGVQA